MRIKTISSIIHDEPVDILICAGGYEERCIHYVDTLDLTKVAFKLALCFPDSGIGSPDTYARNIEYLKNHGFLLEYPSNTKRVYEIFEQYLGEIKKDSIIIRIDYSSMRRFWYGDVLLFLSQQIDRYKSVKLQFVYSIYTLVAKTEMLGVEEIYPMNGFSSLTIPDKPTALLLGIGSEKGVPQYVKEFFNSDCIHYYYTDTEFGPSMEDLHKEHFDHVPEEFKHKYKLCDMIKVIQDMSEVCKTLYSDYRIIVLPCGPKPFTLCAMMLSIIIPKIEVWYLKKIHDRPNEIEWTDSILLTTEVEFV